MGMFDGASPCELEGSTAEIAHWLNAPVVLVVDAHGAARSLAATVKGFAEFEPSVCVAGVVANRSGSAQHRVWLAEALSAASLAPLVGAVPLGAFPTLESRHLGLVTADRQSLTDRALEQLADACRDHVDLPFVVNLARSAGELDYGGPAAADAALSHPTRLRLGIARDDAFHFYYPDNLESLERNGAELIPFSPLTDTALPANLDALYLGGGYPEVHAARLAGNAGMLESVRRFAAASPIYVECGGLIYLARSVTTLDGTRHGLAGVLPIDVAMLPSLKALSYVEASLLADGLWGPAGAVCRGHEFHYSEITADDSQLHGWRRAYAMRCRGRVAEEGFAQGRVLASYVHLHWASRPEVARQFVSGWAEEK